MNSVVLLFASSTRFFVELHKSEKKLMIPSSEADTEEQETLFQVYGLCTLSRRPPQSNSIVADKGKRYRSTAEANKSR